VKRREGVGCAFILLIEAVEPYMAVIVSKGNDVEWEVRNA